MANGLSIARGFTLDPDYVAGGTFALLAKKGAGKSYTARVLAEEFWAKSIPFVLLDPMGTSWGLRADADGGEGGGLPIPIFGGDHADAPLERTGGTLMADLVIDEGISMILDLSALGTRAAERQFAHDFFDRLYRRNRDLVHLLVDEADLFAPQKPQPGDAPLLGVTENIVRRGRNRGIGITLITQRPAVLNKDVLTQVDGLVAMRIVGKQDRDAVDDWVRGHADQEAAAEVKATLASLANGECWWWIPELGILERVQVRASRTFDSSPTKKAGESRREPKSLAEINLGQIEERMAATIERAKADDPKELRKTIASLKRELASVSADVTERIIEKEVPVEVPAISDEQLELLQAIVGELRDVADTAGALRAVGDQIEEALRHVRQARDSRPTAEEHRRAARPNRGDAEPPARPTRPTPRREPADASSYEEEKLGKGELKVLGVLAEFPDGRTQSELAFLAGYSANASTIGVILSKLRRLGLVEQGQPIRPTQAGLDAVGGPVERPTGQALLDMWLNHPRMGEGERRVLRALIDLYPDVPTNDELAEMTGYSPTASTLGVILSKLRKLGLVQRGQRRVAAELMEAIEV